MSRRKVRKFNIVHPDNPEEYSDRSTGEVFRPHMWEVRKALLFIQNILDKEDYSTDVIDSLVQTVTVMDKDDPDRTIVLIDEFNSVLYRLFIELWEPAQKEYGLRGGIFTQPKFTRSKPLFIIQFTLHCWLYYAGLAPIPTYKPDRHRRKARTDIWRTQLVCPVCNKVFSPEGSWDRQESLRRYSSWLYEHSKFECQKQFITKKEK